ncbi:MAG: hypothetical protein LGB70_03950 [Sulfurovum sp.]|nr:hypothetical protein [Sulfurovum sp.]
MKGLNYWKARNSLLESIIKIALYADDLTMFLKDEEDMQQALDILADFSTFSGLEINRMKSEAMPVTNVLLKLKRTGREGWKTLKE